MNMIVCRHPGDNGKYIFRVPEEQELEPGMYVNVETRRGEQPAKTITGTFRADPKVICPLWGTTPKDMMRVLSVMRELQLEWNEEPDRQEQAFVDDE